MSSKVLYKELIAQDPETTPCERPGRNATMMAQRNLCMLARYFYYGHYRRKKFDEIITLLVAEFFISTDRIIRIIQKNTATLKEMKEQRITRYYMQSRWPHYRWW